MPWHARACGLPQAHSQGLWVALLRWGLPCCPLVGLRVQYVDAEHGVRSCLLWWVGGDAGCDKSTMCCCVHARTSTSVNM